MKTKHVLFLAIILAISQFSFAQNAGLPCNPPHESYVDAITQSSVDFHWFSSRETTWEVQIGRE